MSICNIRFSRIAHKRSPWPTRIALRSAQTSNRECCSSSLRCQKHKCRAWDRSDAKVIFDTFLQTLGNSIHDTLHISHVDGSVARLVTIDDLIVLQLGGIPGNTRHCGDTCTFDEM